MQEIFKTQNIIIYLLLINIVGFLIMYFDKRKAIKGSWRIPENTLFLITGLRRRYWNNCWNVYF